MFRKTVPVIILLALISIALFSSAMAQITVVEVFNESFTENGFENVWEYIHNTNYQVMAGQLHSDGVLDSSGRYVGGFRKDLTYNAPNYLEMSFWTILESPGYPQQGAQSELNIYPSHTGFYTYTLHVGHRGGFLSAPSAISFTTGDATGVDYLIQTNYAPVPGQMYHVKAVRQNGIWSLYVDDGLVGTVNDPWGWTDLRNVYISTVGSVVIDNISIKVGVPNLPAEATQDLIDTVSAFNLHQGIDNSLDAKLQNVLAALDDVNGGNMDAACGKLNAFINEVNAQKDKKLTIDQADQLIEMACQIKEMLNCPCLPN